MPTLAETRDDVRLALEDMSSSPIWSDEEIDAGLRQSLERYSHRVPQVKTTNIPVAQGDSSLTLPDGVHRVLRVTDPRGSVIPPQTIPLRGTAGAEQSWEVWGNRVEFARRLPGDEVEIRYLGPRAFPTDDQSTVPVPEDDLSLLITGAVRWCLEQRAIADWKRGSLPARYEMVLRRAQENEQTAWRTRDRQVRTGRILGTS
jgi:hypothetical protein